MENRLYAAYGSNLNRRQMARRCRWARVVGKTQLKGWRLLFRGMRDSAVATVERHEGGRVPVLIWEITPDDEAALDIYEGYPVLYRKMTVEVELNGLPVEVMMYVMNEGRPLGQPSPEYYACIYEGYKEAGFYIGTLRKAAQESVEKE